MVLTRSGKSTFTESIPVQVPVKKVSRKKTPKIPESTGRSSSILRVVAQQPASDASPVETIQVKKKRSSPMKSINSPSKRSKTESPLENNILTTIDASSDLPQSCPLPVQDVKKIGISEDEKQMNGAPEGDLYDVVLLENTQLSPFASKEQAEEEFLRNLQQYNETTVWAEKYECITIFRRMILYHETILACDQHKPNHIALFNCLIDGIQSLRSSNVRNSLLCIKQYCMIKLDTAKKDGIWVLDSFGNLVTVLLNRLGSGPKFLCDATFEVAITLYEYCPPNYSIDLLSNFVNHRNIDTSWKSIQLLVLAFRQITKESWETFLQTYSTTTTVDSDLVWMKSGLSLLFLALSSKKPQGKEKAKETWQQLHSLLGQDIFVKLLEISLTTAQSNEIQRGLQKTTSTSSVSLIAGIESKGAARMPLKAMMMANATSADTSSQKQRVPFAALKPSFKATSLNQEVKVCGEDSVMVVVVDKPWLKKPQQQPQNNENQENAENILQNTSKPSIDMTHRSPKKGKGKILPLGKSVKLVAVGQQSPANGGVPYDFMLHHSLPEEEDKKEIRKVVQVEIGFLLVLLTLK